LKGPRPFVVRYPIMNGYTAAVHPWILRTDGRRI